MSSAAIRLPAWHRSTFAIALVGSFLMWASLPNFAWSWLGSLGPYLGWLGWIAPVPWLVLVRTAGLPGRRPYRAIYLAGLAFWLAAIYWLSLPHPAVIPLWFILAAYLAIYVPLFVGLSRVAVHRFALPLWLVAPTVWTGLELARAHLLTGFLMGSLAHTQVNWTQLIQISDLVGEYGVDFIIMLTAACITTAFRIADFLLPGDSDNQQFDRAHRRPSAIPNPQSQLMPRTLALLPAVLVLSATLVYGHLRLDKADEVAKSLHTAGPRLALIQGNSLAEWKTDRDDQIMQDYVSLSQKAMEGAREKGDSRPVNLVVWPETMYRNPLRDFDPGFQMPAGADVTADELIAHDQKQLADLTRLLGTAVLVGIDRRHFLASEATSTNMPAKRVYNSAVLVGHDGKIVSTYDKVHRVMFGEYIPFADWMPFLYRISPLTGGIEAGAGPVAMRVNGMYCIAPNICYETVLPHVIRRQITTLESRNEYPDALVNVTNDAWYWGSSGLDMHLACGVFRAVETRVPLVIAANGGISAWIDHRGRIRGQIPRQKADYLLADIEPSGMRSPHMRFGDWFAGACLACCGVLAVFGWKSKRDIRKTRRQGDKETRR